MIRDGYLVESELAKIGSMLTLLRNLTPDMNGNILPYEYTQVERTLEGWRNRLQNQGKNIERKGST
jgi:hypothetical protein